MTEKDYLEKIDLVKKDITKLQSEAGNDRKVSALLDFIDYLKYEMEEAKKRANQS
jgi:hypothetical protein